MRFVTAFRPGVLLRVVPDLSYPAPSRGAVYDTTQIESGNRKYEGSLFVPNHYGAEVFHGYIILGVWLDLQSTR